MKKFSSTMRASLRRTSRNKRITRVLVGVLVVLVLFYAVPRTVSFVASLLLTPVVMIESWFSESTATIPSYFRDRNQLLAELDDVQQELAFQSGADLTINRLLAENQRLRSLLGATSTPRIAAGVIGRPTVVPYDVLVLDQGSRDGIRVQAPVFSSRDQVIGYISEVFLESSVVTLVTSPGLESTVYILGPDIYTTAVGQGGGILQVGVPQGIQMKVGDLVVIPSFDAGVYGEIVEINSLPTRPEQYGFVAVDVPLQSIRWVSVGTETLEPISFDTARSIVDRIKNDAVTSVPVPAGVLVELPSEATTTATSTAASSTDLQ